MLVSGFMTRVSYSLRGTDDDAPVQGSDEWKYWLDTLNRKKNELYDDVTRRWENTFEIRSLGTVTASTAPSFDLDDDFLGASDYIYVVTTGNARVEYRLIKPGERLAYKRECYIAGMAPQVLYVTNEIKSSENIVGGTLYLPGFWLPADLARSTDELPFLSPDWAVMAVAAEIAGNDIVYEDKEANLTAKANNLYNQMYKKNRRGTYKNPRVSPTVVRRIGQRAR